jgi:nucleoside phosphorylase
MENRKAVILTALPVEYLEVRQHLNDIVELTNKGTVYEKGIFNTENGDWEVLLVEIGAGNNTAAFEAERALEYFQPEVCLFVGVAGGIKDAGICDVVVARKVYGYASGKSEKEFLPRPDVGNSSYALTQRSRAVIRNGQWVERIMLPHEKYPQPKAFLGAIAAGEAVVASTESETYKFLRRAYGDSLAVEMEGRGFLAAVEANIGVEGLIIRGISDLIHNKSDSDDDLRQRIASKHAAAFAFEVLATLDLPSKKAHQSSSEIKQIDKQDVEITFDNNELFVAEPENHLSGKTDKILRILVQNLSNNNLSLRVDVDIESKSFERIPLTWDTRREQTGFFLYRDDKKFINLLEYRSNKPNEIKFHSTPENHSKSIIRVESNESTTIILMVFGDKIKRYMKRFNICIDENGLQFEEIM